MDSKLKLGKEDLNLYQGPVKNNMKKALETEQTKISKNKDKKDYATVQQVFDKFTLKMLNKFYTSETIQPISTEVISSGKEANVYYTTNIEKTKEYALKVYKTRVLQFKDREDYISGEYRFKDKGKNTRTNPHKLIKAWAEKEFRNLHRLQRVGIRVPEPIKLKENILLMEFIGKDTIPAKRLRDVPLSVEEYSKHYVEIIKMIRTMFLQAKLVHGDLSEFNLLYWEGQIIMIDVSQTMEDNHPLAIEFLKRDLYNLNLYFISKSVITFKLRSLFKFVTDPQLKEEELDVSIQQMIDEVQIKGQDNENEIKELFMGINIPRTLFEFDYLDLDRMLKLQLEREEQGLDQEDLIYDKLTGLKTQQKDNFDFEDEEQEELQEEELEREPKKIVTKEEEKEVRKQNKSKVKEENREKRKTKMPKKLKKKLIKKSEKKQNQLIYNEQREKFSCQNY